MKRWQQLPVLLLGLLLAAGAVWGLSRTQAEMNRLRVAHELTETTILDNAPPAVAFTTVALGGFRGILADYLWLRATRLQEDASYFEMYQLASWIVKLQPRFTGATAFLAWNMAYNISVTCNDFADRWRWVNRGIELIRDEALAYNPGDPLLYKELSWIYLHKLGQDMDDANRFYKLRLAEQMTAALGEPPVDWDALAAAARTPDELAAKLGPASAFPRLLAAQSLTFADLEQRFRKDGGTLPEFLKPLSAADQRALTACLRRRWLLEVYKLDTARMADLNRRYGDLDWRLPQAHGIYWADLGLDRAPGRKDINCERMIFQGLAQAYRGGRLLYFKDTQTLETTPNLAIIPAVHQAYLDSIAKHPDNNSISAGHENFLVDAVVNLYTFGRTTGAREYLDILRKKFPGNPRYRKPVEEFVLGELAEDMTSSNYNQAQAAVQGYLFQSCYFFSLGDDEPAAMYEQIARKLWTKYMNSIGQGTTERRGLPPYDQIKKNVVENCIKQFPPQFSARLRNATGKPPPAPGESKP